MSIGAVLYCRNDGWKDNKRVLINLLSFIEECDEVWYIDWNSPKESLIENIRKDLPKTGKLKHIVINPVLATELLIPYSDAQVCCENLACNIGIRRATTDWIIKASTDIIAPKRELLLPKLKDIGTFYTISRREAPLSVVDQYLPQEWKDIRERMTIEVGPRYFLDGASPNDHTSILNSCGDFQVAHRHVWYNIRGFEEGMVHTLFSDSNVQKKVITHGLKLKPLFEPPVYHIEHQGHANTSGNTKYNNNIMWLEMFDRTLNHRKWGCDDLDLPVETI